MIREKCVLCERSIIEFYRIDNIPSFMGVINDNHNIIYNDIVFGECEYCKLLQNINLLDPNIVYLNNHNIDIIGDIWKGHYIELCDFIKENSKKDIVLEIGDPSAKLARNLKDFFKKWIIIEPNTELENFDNIEIYKEFFMGKNPTNYNIDTIIHSHVFEHIYEPINFLNNCNDILSEGGVTIFSIPNIKWLLENNALPINILHFEHTYYINEDDIELFLNKCGFNLDKIFKYKNHSIFIKASKMEKLKNKSIPKNIGFKDKDKFMNLVKLYEEKIKELNIKLKDKEYYLYSAHINSQYLLFNGINKKNIKGLLDSSKTKIGKKLYGYDYDIFSPEILKNSESFVLTSHMGVYYEEIKENLLKINNKINII